MRRFKTACMAAWAGWYNLCRKTERCLETRLHERATLHETSAIAQHFLRCQDAQNSVNTNTNTTTTEHPDTEPRDKHTSHMTNLILNNYKIIYSNTNATKYRVLIMEALFIKSLKPELNHGLKASKLSLFEIQQPQYTHPQQRTDANISTPSPPSCWWCKHMLVYNAQN